MGAIVAPDDLWDVELLFESACYANGFVCREHLDEVVDDQRQHFFLAEHVHKLLYS